ncbi:MAG: ATP-binding protein [Planctomycetota bacterium]
MTDEPAPTAELRLDSDAFVRSFPFSFVLDGEDRVVLAGRALVKRLAGELPISVNELFETCSKRDGSDVGAAIRKTRKGLKVRVIGTDIQLKGEPVPCGVGGQIAMVVSPVVSTVEQMAGQGLQLQEFSRFDATPDLLLSMQAQKSALSDARAISERLEKSVQEAEEALRVKARFMAVMSHEIRTPMNGLGSMVDLLIQTELTAEQRELTLTLDDCAKSLQSLLNDVLDISKIEAEKLVAESVPMSLGETVTRVVRVFEIAAEERGVRVEAQIADDVPALILGDPHRFRQIVSNLVSNAIKFTSDGNVTITVERVAADCASVKVRDTGVGIPESAWATIFDPFTQADASTTREYGGTGLGLSIAQGLARAMGGDLTLAQSGPEGTTFELVLPLIEAEPTEESEAAATGSSVASTADSDFTLSIRSVLVVDDNPVNLIIAERLLKNLGVDARAVDSGERAIEEVRARSFDLVLLDLMMPRMGGVEAARRIRELDVPWSDIPLVAFSADIRPEVRDEVMSAGMQGFLEKPVRLPAMAALLERIGRDSREVA